jgi:hypothetical protein
MGVPETHKDFFLFVAGSKMKLSCSAYQAGSSWTAQKILSGHTQNYGATSSTANTTGDSSHGITMPTWTVRTTFHILFAKGVCVSTCT